MVLIKNDFSHIEKKTTSIEVVFGIYRFSVRIEKTSYLIMS
jgi:hypothetical protein